MWHSNHVKLPLPEPDVTLVVDAQGLVVHGEARFAINLTAWHTPVRRRGPLPCSLRPHASDASTPPKCWPLLTRAPPPHPPKLSADPTKSLLQVDDLVMSVGGAPWEPSKLPAIRSGGITVHIQRLTPYVYTKVPKQKRKQAPRHRPREYNKRVKLPSIPEPELHLVRAPGTFYHHDPSVRPAVAVASTVPIGAHAHPAAPPMRGERHGRLLFG